MNHKGFKITFGYELGDTVVLKDPIPGFPVGALGTVTESGSWWSRVQWESDNESLLSPMLDNNHLQRIGKEEMPKRTEFKFKPGATVWKGRKAYTLRYNIRTLTGKNACVIIDTQDQMTTLFEDQLSDEAPTSFNPIW